MKVLTETLSIGQFKLDSIRIFQKMVRDGWDITEMESLTSHVSGVNLGNGDDVPYVKISLRKEYD